MSECPVSDFYKISLSLPLVPGVLAVMSKAADHCGYLPGPWRGACWNEFKSFGGLPPLPASEGVPRLMGGNFCLLQFGVL